MKEQVVIDLHRVKSWEWKMLALAAVFHDLGHIKSATAIGGVAEDIKRAIMGEASSTTLFRHNENFSAREVELFHSDITFHESKL